MRRIHLIGLLLVLSVVTYFFAISAISDDSETSSRPTATNTEPHQAGEAALPVIEVAETEREDVGRSGPADLAPAGITYIVEGEVATPPACANDDGLFVYAWDREVSQRYIQSFLTTEVGSSLTGGATLLARSEVGRDRHFQLELSTELKEVHLFACGQLAYSQQSLPTLLSDGVNEAYLATSCGACVEGRVLEMGEEDPSAISVVLTTSNRTIGAARGREFRTRSTELTADGHFRFVAIPAEHPLVVQVEPNEMAPGLVEVAPLSEGETRTLKHSLLPGAKVSGRVVDANGDPVAGAQVQTTGGRAAIAFAGWARQEVETDESGEFSISGLPTGQVMIAAGADGYLDSGLKPLRLEIGEERRGIELRLSEGNSLVGTVHWPDGQPVSGAGVNVTFDRAALLGSDSINSARGGSGSGTTDEGGAFRVSALGNGPFTLSVSHTPEGQRLEDWLADEAHLMSMQGDPEFDEDEAFGWTASVNGLRPNAPPTDLVLTAPQVLAGRVVDDVGAPVEEYDLVLVRLEDSALGSIGVETRRRSIKDPEGRFITAGVSAGNWNAYAIADGFSKPDPTPITVPREAGAEPILITLELASTVSGLVLTATGGPAKNAQVRVKTALSQMISSLSEDLKEPSASTGSAGEFRLDGLRSGQVELIASAEGYANSAPESVTLTAGEETTNLRLSLRIGGTITGELYGADGTLAVNATVQVIRPTDYSTQITSTDEEGFFRVERLEPGNWQVIGLPNLLGAISGEENQGGRGEMLKGMQMAFVELEDAEEEHVILGEPPADPVLLSGSVTHLGEPVKDAALVMILEGKGGFPKIGSTDDQGRYELKLDEPGEYLLTVQRTLGGDYTEQHQCSFNLKVPKVAEHRHDVELPGGEVRGRVTFDSGEPAAGVPVTLSPDYSGGYNVLSEQTNTVTSTREDGSFSIDGVTAGGYHLRAGGVSHIQRMLSSAPNAGHLFGQDELHLVIAKAQLIDDVRLVLPLAGSIAVHVVDVAGAPVQGASIFIRSEDGRQTEALSAASTNTNGVCNYEGLSEGTYQVSARTSDQASSEGQRVRVLAGETASVELKLDSGTMLRVVTVDGEGAPLASNLRVIDSEGRDHASYPAISALQAMMATEGLSRSTQSFGPLPPGRYRVYAYTSDGREEDKPVNLRGQAERVVKIRFR